MLNDKKRRLKLMVILFVIILLILIIALYIAVSLNRSKDFSIGKMVYLDVENGSADYLETLLRPENKNDLNNKIILLNEEAVEKLIQYMRENNLRIVSGQYKISQTSNYEDLINVLEFEKE